VPSESTREEIHGQVLTLLVTGAYTGQYDMQGRVFVDGMKYTGECVTRGLQMHVSDRVDKV